MITTRDAITNPKNLIYAYSSNPYNPVVNILDPSGLEMPRMHRLKVFQHREIPALRVQVQMKGTIII